MASTDSRIATQSQWEDLIGKVKSKADTSSLATVATTGSYTDLTNKPTIPVVNDATLTVAKNGETVDTFTANAATNKTINITVPVTAADVSALPDSTKYGARLSMTIDSSTYVVTATLKDQDGNTLGAAQTIDLPLESVVVSGAYDSQTKEVVLTLKDGSTIRFSVADLVSGLQSEITPQNKLDADLVDDSTSINQFVTASDKTTWNGKQNALTAGSNVTISNNTISATDTTYTAGSGLSLNGTVFSADTSILATQTDLTTKQDALTAGNNISISGSTISATDTTYSAGTGLNLTGTTFSVDTSAIQEKLTAGSNVSISGNTISATDTTYTAGTGLSLSSGQFSVDTSTIATQTDLSNGLATKQNTLTAGNNIQISNDTISATDTTYSDFTGTDGTTAGAAGLVPAPATTDAGKVLGANGAWVTGGPAVVQSLGTSTTDVMSQNAATKMVYPSYQYHPDRIGIGEGVTSSNSGTIALGDHANATKVDALAIGARTAAYAQNSIAIGGSYSGTGTMASVSNNSNYSIAIGAASKVGGYSGDVATHAVALGDNSFISGGTDVSYSVALGAYSKVSQKGQVDISTLNAGASNTYGYNSSSYRLLTGLYDPQSAHDAANKEYVDNATINGGTTAPTTTTIGAVGTQYTYVDTTGTPTAHLCVCTEIDTTDPDNPVYTWQTLV